MTRRRLSRAQFRDALAKGLGRALVAVRAEGRLLDEDAVLDASLHNRSYDPQLEGSRAPWMMEMLRAADAVDRFRMPILSALSRSSDTWDLDQLCDFAEAFARQGLEEARSALYEVWHRKPDSTAPWLAEEQIVRLDGLEGLLYLAGRIGAAIRHGENDFDLESLVRDADRHCGSNAVAAALADAAAHSLNLRAFCERLEEDRQAHAPNGVGQETLSERMRAITAEQVVAFVENREGSLRKLSLSSWGRLAGEEALRTLASKLFLERDPSNLIKYLKIFSRVPLPDFDERLLGLSSHPNQNVRHRAFQALAANRSPKVRSLALEQLEAGRIDGDTVALLKCNYEPGDHRLIETLLTACDDPDEMHWLCWELGNVFEHNETRECAKAMQFAYEHTPCSNCRERFVSTLLKVDSLPAKLCDECWFDANQHIRELVQSA